MDDRSRGRGGRRTRAGSRPPVARPIAAATVVVALAGCGPRADPADVWGPDCDAERCSVDVAGFRSCSDDRGVVRICRTGDYHPCTAYHWRDLATCPADLPFPEECVEGDPGTARCREIDAEPCTTPGAQSCEDPYLVRCMEDGYLEHWARCTGDNPRCVDPPETDPLCTYDGSYPCTPGDFGESGTGRLCDGDRVLVCHPDARVTQVVGTCSSGFTCVPASVPGEAWCVPVGADA